MTYSDAAMAAYPCSLPGLCVEHENLRSAYDREASRKRASDHRRTLAVPTPSMEWAPDVHGYIRSARIFAICAGLVIYAAALFGLGYAVGWAVWHV